MISAIHNFLVLAASAAAYPRLSTLSIFDVIEEG
jgi:hypothetical protein